jgi:hypothetical protein
MERTLVAVVLVLALALPRAAADEVAPTPPDPCASCRLWHKQHRTAAIMGISLLASGYVLSLSHAATQPGVRAATELVPIAGPIVALFHNDTSPGWTMGLTFAAWSQAMGVLVLSIALAEW